MKYLKIEISTSVEGIEPVISALMEIGINDTVVEDPRDIQDLLQKKNEYDWDYVDQSVLELENQIPKVIVYLEEDENSKKVVRDVRIAIEDLRKSAERGDFGEDFNPGSLEMSVESDDDSQWKDNWKEYFKPSKIGNTIVVKPTWYDYNPAEGEKVLEIDPGMAFGTGTHETTSLCIKLMEDYLKPGDKVLDVGCGSGILSIAAALLGAEEVRGIEIDPVAVQIAMENVQLNKAEKIIDITEGDLTKGLDFKADLVVANLMADLVMMLSKDVTAHLNSGGKYISSGILLEKEEIVSEAIEECGFKIIEVKRDGMWCAIVAEVK